MESETTVNPAPPDWSAIDEEIICPLCDYNLRGLTESRCPECGYSFTWPEILDATQRPHPYLFEHHPERNVLSFWQTALGGLRPRRFWLALHPAQPSVPSRLVAYWAATAVIGLLALLGAWSGPTTAAARGRLTNPAFRAMIAAQLQNPQTPNEQSFADTALRYGSIQAFLDAQYPTRLTPRAVWAAFRGQPANVFIQQSLGLLAWPWLTFAMLMIFQGSMRKVRVRRVHVLRCALYSSDILLWVGLLMVFATAAIALLAGRGAAGWFRLVIVIGSVLGPVLYTLRLRIAYRLYLRFDRPFATVLASQLVVVLVVMNLVFARYIGLL